MSVDPTAAQPVDPDALETSAADAAAPVSSADAAATHSGGATAAGRDATEPAATVPRAALASWPAGSIQDEIIRQSIDAVIITDEAFRVRVWNPAAERLYGIPASTAIGQRMGDIIETLDTTGRLIDGLFARAELEASGVWRQRIVHRPRFGPLAKHEVVVDSIVTLLLGPEGESVGALGVNRDITASARLESEMTALGSLVLATDRARTKDEVAQAALDILCRATGAEGGLVTSMDRVYEATAHIGVSPETIKVIVNYGQFGGPLMQALQAPDAYVTADVATAPLREDVRAAVLADGIRHLIVVGLRLSGRLTGILALGWRHPAPHEPSPAIMHQAAAVIAASLENARLLGAVESGLREERMLTHRMRALVELTRLPETASGGTSSLDRLIADVDEVIGGDGTSLVWVVDGKLTLAGAHRIDPDWILPLLDRPFAAFPLATKLIEGSQTILVPLDPGHVRSTAAAASASQGYRTLAAFAIRDDAELVGIVFAVFRRAIDDLEIDQRTLDAIGRVLDISLANRRLREVVIASERRYRELFEGSPDALVVQSTDEIVVDANPAARRLYGGELVGRPVSDLIVDDAAWPLRDEIDPGGFTQHTGLGRRLDGSTFPEEVDLRPIEIGGQRQMLAIVRDLTERTRMQAELAQAQKMDAIGLLVAGVAHELNNPLASIVGFSHLLRTDPNLPDDLRRQADLLVQEANRTRVIVQNLLDFARQRPPERVEMELRPLIDSVLGLQSYVLARNQLHVDIDLPPDLPHLLIDRSQMQQVLINLTVNAAQAIASLDRPGTISIRARSASTDEGPTVQIAIADDGPGVPPEIVDRLFMPFVTTKEPGAGTGLGLSVSFGIVRGHGGTLRHERNPDGGATFVIELPVSRDERAAVAESDIAAPGRAASELAGSAHAQSDAAGSESARLSANEAAPAPVQSAPVAGVTTSAAATASAAATSGADDPPDPPAGERKLRVLVLDDEPSIREFLGRVLTRNGHEPILANTGAAALEIVRTDPPDVILCDHRMAGMSGTEFHAAVMEIAPKLGARFAFMSGDVLNPELRDFADARGVHLLAKPFDIAAVGSIVSELVANPLD